MCAYVPRRVQSIIICFAAITRLEIGLSLRMSAPIYLASLRPRGPNVCGEFCLRPGRTATTTCWTPFKAIPT